MQRVARAVRCHWTQSRRPEREGPELTEFERRFDELIQEQLTRRRLLRRGAAGALSMSAIAYLAACGDETSKPKGEQSKVIPKGKIASSVYFANWPAYIDVN